MVAQTHCSGFDTGFAMCFRMGRGIVAMQKPQVVSMTGDSIRMLTRQSEGASRGGTFGLTCQHPDGIQGLASTAQLMQSSQGCAGCT